MKNKKLYEEAQQLPSIDRVVGEFITEIDELELKVDGLTLDNEAKDEKIRELENEVIGLKEELDAIVKREASDE